MEVHLQYDDTQTTVTETKQFHKYPDGTNATVKQIQQCNEY